MDTPDLFPLLLWRGKHLDGILTLTQISSSQVVALIEPQSKDVVYRKTITMEGTAVVEGVSKADIDTMISAVDQCYLIDLLEVKKNQILHGSLVEH